MIPFLNNEFISWRERGTSWFNNNSDYLIGLVITSATAEHEGLGSIPGSREVLLVFSVREFPVAAQNLWDGDGKRLEEYKKDFFEDM